ncbi:MAG: cupin domain-containing protein, partial [Planctomycetota bacterium]
VLPIFAVLACCRPGQKGEGTARQQVYTTQKSKCPKLYVSFTMDCERIGSECMAGGPRSWELSERAIHGYCETLLAAGITPTLFIVPECGQQHAELFKSFAIRGVELGMHLHPQCFRDHRYDKYLGEYDTRMQKEILIQGVDILQKALGVRPKAFRGGNFSANDETYQVLFNLGFRQGSLSDPGRHVPRYAAMWKEAFPHAHWANAGNKLIPGELPFFEVPVTTNPNKQHANGFPYELRIESGSFKEWHLPIINHALEIMERDKVDFRVLSIFTHNYYDYSNPDVKKSKVIRGYIEYLEELRMKYDVIPITLEKIRQAYVEHCVGQGKNYRSYVMDLAKSTAVLIRHEGEAPRERSTCGWRDRLVSREDRDKGIAAWAHAVDIDGAKEHYHKIGTELYYVLEGEGVVRLDGVEHPVRKGSLVHIPPGVIHGAVGRMRVLVIGIPDISEEDLFFPKETKEKNND